MTPSFMLHNFSHRCYYRYYLFIVLVWTHVVYIEFSTYKTEVRTVSMFITVDIRTTVSSYVMYKYANGVYP